MTRNKYPRDPDILEILEIRSGAFAVEKSNLSAGDCLAIQEKEREREEVVRGLISIESFPRSSILAIDLTGEGGGGEEIF